MKQFWCWLDWTWIWSLSHVLWSTPHHQPRICLSWMNTCLLQVAETVDDNEFTFTSLLSVLPWTYLLCISPETVQHWELWDCHHPWCSTWCRPLPVQDKYWRWSPAWLDHSPPLWLPLLDLHQRQDCRLEYWLRHSEPFPQLDSYTRPSRHHTEQTKWLLQAAL